MPSVPKVSLCPQMIKTRSSRVPELTEYVRWDTGGLGVPEGILGGPEGDLGSQVGFGGFPGSFWGSQVGLGSPGEDLEES